MQAVFRFRGDEEIGISNQVDGVLVELIRGSQPGYHGDGQDGSHYMTTCSKEKCGLDPASERVNTMISLSKSEARSIASAIMGAAAEL
jgi:hypothetical protein